MNSVTKTKKMIVLYFLAVVLVAAATFAYSARAQALLQVGSEAPDFTLKNINGQEASLSGFLQRKTIVLVFWSTWSANSQRALKRFEDFQRKYRDSGLQIVGINADNQTISSEDIDNIKKMLKELDITFPVLLDRNLNTFHSYGIIALPSTVVISGGKIIYELPGLPLVGTEDMFDYLLTLVGESPRAKVKPRYQPQHEAVADANLARGFVKKKMTMMAYPLFKRAIEKDPKYILPYVELAKLYAADGNFAQAQETLKKALSAEPDNVVVMSELGYLLCREGKPDEAVEILAKADQVNTYTPSHYYFAYAMGKEGKFNEALAAFAKALALNPFDYMTYLLRGEIYEDNKKPREAAADYRKALELLLQFRADSPPLSPSIAR
jgi:Tfp pilus assembly protein PilF/peroxiredoxin